MCEGSASACEASGCQVTLRLTQLRSVTIREKTKEDEGLALEMLWSPIRKLLPPAEPPRCTYCTSTFSPHCY